MAQLPSQTRITDRNGNPIDIGVAFSAMVRNTLAVTQLKGKIMVIGNGGSAAIASHCASHFPNNGGLRITAFNDASAVTASANDFGYENVYSSQIEAHADEGDILIAISSSGRSKNIINASEKAKDKGCAVYTFSGFDPKNPLSSMGDMNFYVPAAQYGYVECTHMNLLHFLFDMMLEAK